MENKRNRGISLITIIGVAISLFCLILTIVLALNKNSSTKNAEEKTLQEMQEMVTDKISSITINCMEVPTLYSDSTFSLRLKDVVGEKMSINEDNSTLGLIYFVAGKTRGCIVFGKEKDIENKIEGLEYYYTGKKLSTVKGKKVNWYIDINNTLTIKYASLNDETLEKKIAPTISTRILNNDVTSSNYFGNYLGRQVEYTLPGKYNLKWRLFYVDFDNKYGDGKGTIYLKLDSDPSRIYDMYTTDLNGNEYNVKSQTKLLNMNPLWANNHGKETKWNTNEKIAAFLCDTSRWNTEYKNDIATYAIGSPSLEMYIDSYKAKDSSFTLDYKYDFKVTDEASSYGYRYKENAKDVTNATSKYSIDQDDMYSNSTQDGYWWFATPSANLGDKLCRVNSFNMYLDTTSYLDRCGICPVVSIPSTTDNLKFVD